MCVCVCVCVRACVCACVRACVCVSVQPTLECPLLQAQVKAVSRAAEVAWMLAPGVM